MNILITGSQGFVGKNLVESLKNVRDGKDKRDQLHKIKPLTIFEYNKNSTEKDLINFCKKADFVFHLAGVNRPKNKSDFFKSNVGLTEKILKILKKYNHIPVMISSSIQATLEGRYQNSDYGKSKLKAERLLEEYSKDVGVQTYIYRFPNLYGKWSRPNYNSVVSTFCYNIANDLPITINDANAEIELLYIDDLIQEMFMALLGNENRAPDGFCYAQPTTRVKLGELANLLYKFNKMQNNLVIPDVPNNSFEKKLLSTYESYLHPNKFAYKLDPKVDERGSFTEIIKSEKAGQISINVSNPGVTKGQHWHHTKWEKFCVISGSALIQERKIGKQFNGDLYPIHEYRVNGDELTVVDMIPGYTHNIINLSNTEKLITLMWCNEVFDPDKPDTFYEEV